MSCDMANKTGEGDSELAMSCDMANKTGDHVASLAK